MYRLIKETTHMEKILLINFLIKYLKIKVECIIKLIQKALLKKEEDKIFKNKYPLILWVQ